MTIASRAPGRAVRLHRDPRPAPAFPTHLASPAGTRHRSPPARGLLQPKSPSGLPVPLENGVQGNACPSQAQKPQTRPAEGDQSPQTPAGSVQAGECVACTYTHRKEKKTA